MQIIGLVDIHGHSNFDDKIADVISAADLILIAGDITNFGGERETIEIIERIKELNSKILAVAGNCDREGVNIALTAQKINLHGKSVKVNGIAFYGLGGSNKTPLHTPREFTEDELADVLTRFKQEPDAKFHVLITHAPPEKTKLDKIFLGLHVGSKVVRKFIENFQPDLVICGHIHEARGADKIGKTLIINPGPFPEHYAIIKLEKKIEYELY